MSVHILILVINSHVRNRIMTDVRRVDYCGMIAVIAEQNRKHKKRFVVFIKTVITCVDLKLVRRVFVTSVKRRRTHRRMIGIRYRIRIICKSVILLLEVWKLIEDIRNHSADRSVHHDDDDVLLRGGETYNLLPVFPVVCLELAYSGCHIFIN